MRGVKGLFLVFLAYPSYCDKIKTFCWLNEIKTEILIFQKFSFKIVQFNFCLFVFFVLSKYLRQKCRGKVQTSNHFVISFLGNKMHSINWFDFRAEIYRILGIVTEMSLMVMAVKKKNLIDIAKNICTRCLYFVTN